MTRATLKDVLQPALDQGYAVAGLVVLSWDDAKAFVEAAEAEQVPLILQAGPGFRRAMPLQVIAPMFSFLAQKASVPVVTHLDHATTIEECRTALELGFTSIMFDGSSKPLQQNIEMTSQAVALARNFKASCEGEIGFVGYVEGAPGAVTDPLEAGEFARETGVDALAVSVGNVHLQTSQMAEIDLGAIRAIEAQTEVPLVLHGGSGIPVDMRRKLARETHVSKFNIGTELRMAYGASLRKVIVSDGAIFDRLEIAKRIHTDLVEAARKQIRVFSRPSQ